MVRSICNNCGEPYDWHWEEAFDKFGFNDGDGQLETFQVEDMLCKAGYIVQSDHWGPHNTLITSIKKDGMEFIPHDKPRFWFGYDNPRDYLPKDIIILLDRELPSASHYKMTSDV